MFELPYLPDSPEGDPGGELVTLCQPRTNAVGVPAEDDTDLDNGGLLFGEPRELGSATSVTNHRNDTLHQRLVSAPEYLDLAVSLVISCISHLVITCISYLVIRCISHLC